MPGTSMHETEPMTLREALAATTQQLQQQELLRDKAALDARQMVSLATGRNHVAMLTHPEAVLTAAESATLQALLERRLRFEPVQHLRGSQEFYGRDFLVTPDVLIPRPETEDLVTAVLEATPDRNTPLRIADVGTGSGALAITLALELPRSQVVGFDLSEAALTVARRNAHQLGAEDRVRFVRSDLLAAAEEAELFDVIVSNPPYIPIGEAATLHPEVRDYEPHLALFAGEDGHSLYRRLVPEAHDRLRLGGLLLLETAGRVDLLLRWLSEWNDVHVRTDLQGIARVVSARRIRQTHAEEE